MLPGDPLVLPDGLINLDDGGFIPLGLFNELELILLF